MISEIRLIKIMILLVTPFFLFSPVTDTSYNRYIYLHNPSYPKLSVL